MKKILLFLFIATSLFAQLPTRPTFPAGNGTNEKFFRVGKTAPYFSWNVAKKRYFYIDSTIVPGGPSIRDTIWWSSTAAADSLYARRDSTNKFLGLNWFNGYTKITGKDTAKADFIYSKTVLGVKHLYWRRDDTTAVALDSLGSGGLSDTARNYTWTGLHTWTQDSLRINTLWYDFPNSRTANTVLYDSLGNGILKWRQSPAFLDKANTWTANNTINAGLLFGGVGYLSLPNKPQTTTGYLWYRDSRVRYFNGTSALALVDSSDLLLYGLKGSANTWTADNTFNGNLFFGASALLYLPVATPVSPLAGYFWRDTDILKYSNSSGTVRSLVFGTGTANQIAYWNSTNSISSLTTVTYPSLTELSYVKGVTSAIQTQINSKIGLTSLSGTSPISYDNTTGVISFLTNTNISWSGSHTFNGAGGKTVSFAAGHYFQLPGFMGSTAGQIRFDGTGDYVAYNNASGVETRIAKYSELPSLSGYATLAGANIWTNTNTYNVGILFGGVGYLSLPNKPQTTTGYLWYRDSRVRYFNGTSALALVDSSDLLLYGKLANTNSWTNSHTFNGAGGKTVSFAAGHYFQLPGFMGVTPGQIRYDGTGDYVSYNNLSGVETRIATYSELSGYVPTSRTLNGLALSSNQTFAVGTTGTNFTISSSGTTHTFNIPDASTTARGLITTGTQTIAGAKTINDGILFGALAYFSLPTKPQTTATYLWYRDSRVRYHNGTSALALVDSSDLLLYGKLASANTWTNANSFSTDKATTFPGPLVFTPDNVAVNVGTIDASTTGSNSGSVWRWTATGSSATLSTMSNPTNGQKITIYHVESSYSLTIDQAGNIITPGTSIVLGQYDSATFVYDSGHSKWVCTAYVDN